MKPRKMPNPMLEINPVKNRESAIQIIAPMITAFNLTALRFHSKRSQ
jgi:hypothetical protein